MPMFSTGRIKCIRGDISLPGDKSIAHRALIHASISNGDCLLSNVSSSQDVETTIRALMKLGISIRKTSESEYRIMGSGGDLAPPSEPLDCADSGTTMRLLMGILASCQFEAELTGDESLLKRPMERLAEPLRKMGVKVETSNGYPPVKMIGSKFLSPLEYVLPVGSAQVKSALIYASMSAKGQSILTDPWMSRDHTEIALETLCGSCYERKTDRNIYKHVIKGPCEFPGFDMNIPGDISSAAYLCALACCLPGSDLTIHAVLLNPRRIKFLEIIREMGGDITIGPDSTELGEITGSVRVKHSTLSNVRIDPSVIPMIIDEIPVLAMVATAAQGEFSIRGAGELRYKESDRLDAVCRNLVNLGASVQKYDDGFSFSGPLKLKKSNVDSLHDHRILMSLIVLSLIHNLDLEFDSPDAINVSFPEFPDYLSLLSGQ